LVEALVETIVIIKNNAVLTRFVANYKDLRVQVKTTT